jgi:ribosomal protein S27AE
MNRVDFTMCWLIMHILHQHRARVMFALPRAVAEQQTLAVRERSKLPDTSVDLPETCHKVAVCHILGCQKIVSYSCPTHTRKTIGHRFGSYNAVYKALACQHKNGSRMQAPLNRRVRDDDAINAAMSYNHAQLALAALTPEQIAANPERYRKDRAAADEWLKRVTAAVKKHVRAEMRVAFATPCNAQPCENYPLIGGVLHSLRQKEKETHYYTTICPRCGVFTTYSSDRVESNGFSCGNCQYTNRLLVNAARCICCGAREYIRLPMLSGEQAAQKARDKKDASRAAKKAKRLAAKELAKAGANAAQTNDTPLEQADELVQTAFHALADRSKLQPHVQPALGNAAATSTDSALPANGQEKRASKRTYDAISSRNANATMKIIERSEVSFHRYVAYDDRPVVGTHTFIEVLLCGNCDRLDPLVRDYGLSLNEFMRLTKDVSPVDGYFANEHSVLDDILENRSLAVLAAATPVTTVAQRKAATAASRRRKPRTPRAPKTTAAAAAAADGTVAKKPRKKRQAKRKQADLDDDVSSSVGSATTTTDTEITTDLLFGDVDDDDDDDAVAAAAVNTATAATVNNEEDDEEDEEAGFMAVLDSIAFND